MSGSSFERLFKRFALLTIISVYVVILAGGIVRATDSGMGCPDWPKCFGQWLPPLSEDELPDNYLEYYKVQGKPVAFNVMKAWVEYVNRLLGALIGIFILVLFILSFRFKSDKRIMPLCGLVLLMVIIEGLVGKYVVSSYLKPIAISIHFWGSLFIILVLMYLLTRLRKDTLNFKNLAPNQVISLQNLTLYVFLFTIAHMILGTGVRQEVDAVAIRYDFHQRYLWVDNLGSFFYIHRSMSILLAALIGWLVYKILKGPKTSLSVPASLLLVFTGLEIGAGVLMNYAEMPAYAQPLHMLLSTLLLGVQGYLYFVLSFYPTPILQTHAGKQRK